MNDPAVTDAEFYRVVFENDRVRVLEYRDRPGDVTHTHFHPDTVMVTMTAFSRVIESGDAEISVNLGAGEIRWLDEQEHRGRNVGDTVTHTILVELKEPAPQGKRLTRLGPSTT